VKLLTGFEKDQVLSWKLFADDPLVIKYRYRGSGVSPGCAKGDCTQGEYALAAHYDENTVKWYYLDQERHHHVRMTRWLFCPMDNFRSWFPQDWSGYRYLRMDFKSTDANARLRVDIEDEITAPMVRRVFTVPPGKWITIQYDLEQASKPLQVELPPENARRLGRRKVALSRLNPAKMADIRIYPEYLDQATTLLLDNVRLVREGSEPGTPYPIITDERPFMLATGIPSVKLRPRTLPDRATLNREPLGEQAARMLDLIARSRAPSYGRLRHITRRGFVAVDNDRMLLTFLEASAGGYEHGLQTTDGGRTWTGLDGQTDLPSSLCHSVNAPAHAAVQAWPDLLLVYTERCCGGGSPANMFFRLLEFDGKGWKLEPPRLVDVDCRHCPEWQVQVLRLANGRIWSAWRQDDRLGRIWLRARYSDDGGKTWQDPDSNALVTIDRDDSYGPQSLGVTWWSDDPELTPSLDRANGRVDSMHAHGNLVLTPYRDTVACVYTKGETLVWSYFDGKQWVPAQLVLKKFCSPECAITVGERDIYISAADKVLHLSEDDWVDDTPPESKGGLLSVSGNKVICFWVDKEGLTASIYASQKVHPGKWSKPKLLAREVVPGSGPRARMDVVAPQWAPDNFVPLAWGPHHEWIKWLRYSTK